MDRHQQTMGKLETKRASAQMSLSVITGHWEEIKKQIANLSQ
jgi:hypothetical protein